jgi:hypothetical protein
MVGILGSLIQNLTHNLTIYGQRKSARSEMRPPIALGHFYGIMAQTRPGVGYDPLWLKEYPARRNDDLKGVIWNKQRARKTDVAASKSQRKPN